MSKRCTKCGEWKPNNCFIINLRDEVILTCISCLDRNKTGLQFIGMTDVERKNYHSRRIAAIRRNNNVKVESSYIDHLKQMHLKGEITELQLRDYIKYFKNHKKDKVYVLSGKLVESHRIGTKITD